MVATTTLINQLISRVKGEISSFIGVENPPPVTLSPRFGVKIFQQTHFFGKPTGWSFSNISQAWDWYSIYDICNTVKMEPQKVGKLSTKHGSLWWEKKRNK